MKIQEFMLKYKVASETKKNSLVKEHIKNVYVPFSEKVAICRTIIEKTHYTGTDELRMYKKNSYAHEVFFSLTLISKYTDIEIDFEKSGEIYDQFSEYDLITAFLSEIPEKERTEFFRVMDMEVADDYDNNRNVVSFLETKMTAMEMAINAISEAFKIADVKDGVTNG